MASWSGAILLPNVGAQGVQRGRRVGVLAVALVDEEARGACRVARPSETAVSRPGLDAAAASMTKTTPSTAAKPSMTSATKSG